MTGTGDTGRPQQISCKGYVMLVTRCVQAYCVGTVEQPKLAHDVREQQ